MRALILGATGFLGPAIGIALNENVEVIGLSRSQSSTAYPWSAHVHADRDDVDAIAAAVSAHRIDIVVDVIAYTLAQTQPLLEALAGRIKRYVLISSCDVYRRYGLLTRTEHGAPEPGLIEETSALREGAFPYRGETPRDRVDPRRFLDDYDKIPIEAAVTELACEWTILRLPMVYGPGDKQRRFRWFLQPVHAGKERIETSRAWLDWTSTYGFVDDVAAGVALAATHPQADREFFNLGERDPVDHTTWAGRFAAATGWQGELVPVDPSDDPGKRGAGLDLTVDLAVSTAKIRRTLGFAEPVTMDDRLRRTIEAERTDND